MKRWAIRITVLLLLGAIVNIAVAWGLASNCPVTHSGTRHWSKEDLTVSPDWWLALNPRLSDAAKMIQFDMRGTARTGIAVVLDRTVWHYTATGWPYSALASVAEVQVTPRVVAMHWGLPVPLRNVEDQNDVLPLRPIWPGFAINTALYAAILWLLVALGGTPFALRRRMRIKRGLCPKCAYDLRGHAGSADAQACPECGTCVTPSR